MIVEMSAEEHGQYMQHATMAQLCPQMLDGKPRKVWVAEAGYCSDTMYEDKLKEKELQHKRLQEALSAYGYEVIAVPIILGFYGTIFTTTVQSAQTLGIERVRVNRLMIMCLCAACTSSLLWSHAFVAVVGVLVCCCMPAVTYTLVVHKLQLRFAGRCGVRVCQSFSASGM